MLLRLLYTALWYLALPVIGMRLWLKGRSYPAYRQHWHERFGYQLPKITKPCIWLHTVSVGEFIAATPFIKRLIKEHPDYTILITSTTPTGRERIQQTFSQQEVTYCYLPYDIPGATHRFLKHFQPRIALIMETELWLNLFARCKKSNIAVVIINGRLSPNSAKNYLRFHSFSQLITDQITNILTQTDADAQRYQAICANESIVITTGNLKFDQEISAACIESGKALRRLLGTERNIWIAASTHPSEEEQVLDAAKIIKAQYPNALLILVPRHPNRFPDVMQLCQQSELSTVLRTQAPSQAELAAADIYLADTMGEMPILYSAADIAFVAGSFAPIGGHNILEPIALQKPVIVGPVMFNFQNIHDSLQANNAIIEVSTPAALAESIKQLFADNSQAQKQVQQAANVLHENQGALEKTCAIVNQLLEKAAGN